MSDPIKAALEAAAMAIPASDPELWPWEECSQTLRQQLRAEAAAAIAAFLRALPVEQPNLAEAVERAAREAGDE